MAYSHAPQGFQAQRNQSVGYNLQQEFEALKADLDLDLSHSNEDDESLNGSAGAGAPRSDSAAALGAESRENTRSQAPKPPKTTDFGSGAPGLSAPAPKAQQGGSRVLSGGPSLLAPAANSPYSMNSAHLTGHNSGHGTLLDALMRERTLSPLGTSGTPGTTGTTGTGVSTGGLQSLLMNKNTAFGGLPSRPQSVNDFSSLLPQSQFLRVPQLHSGNFYLDMLAHTSWLESLTPQEILATLDYWCNNLPFDILLTMKSRLQNHLSLGMQAPPLVFGKVDTYPQYSGDFVADMDAMSFSDLARTPGAGPGAGPGSGLGLLQPKPKANGTFKSHLFADPKVQRPKLADPSLHVRGTHPGDRARSPTSHLYEKTSFLQLAAASHLPHAYGHGQQHGHNHAHGQAHSLQQHPQQSLQQGGNSTDEGYDHAAAHKLGALATINSRVALDFNRKAFQQTGQPRGHTAAAVYEESLNRQANSSSVPTSTQKYSVAAMAGASGATGVSGASASGTPKGVKKELEHASKAKISAPSTPVSANSSMPLEIVNQDLLNNIPAWLKLLRLHKYTDYLKDIYWKDLVELSDQDLEDKGVKALGARRKLLKAFEAVKASQA